MPYCVVHRRVVSLGNGYSWRTRGNSETEKFSMSNNLITFKFYTIIALSPYLVVITVFEQAEI